MRALVMAAAPCLFDDVRIAMAAGGFDRFYAVNAAALRFPIVDTWVSGHPEAMVRWQATYVMQGRPLPEVVCKMGHTGAGDCRVDRIVPLRWDGMTVRRITSTLFACKVALEDGCNRIVVCGAPLDRDGGHLDLNAPQNHDYRPFRDGFVWAHDNVFEGRVRAASGFLAQLMGKPNREWLDE